MEAKISFVSQKVAGDIDKDLMSSEYGFVSEALMELAGLSCAQAINEAYRDNRRVLVICGPGNNGGDGLVCARHLSHFGYSVTICYPKQRNVAPFVGQKLQCEKLNIPFITELPSVEHLHEKFNLIVDAIFGYSFQSENGFIRAPFAAIIETLSSLGPENNPVASIDVPSGWNVDTGVVEGTEGKGLQPDFLISLGVPKLCAQGFRGKHYFGGRFMPPELLKKYEIVLPQFLDSYQYVRLPNELKQEDY